MKALFKISQLFKGENKSKVIEIPERRDILADLFNRGILGIRDAEHLAKHGYEIIFEAGGVVTRVIEATE